MKTTLRWLAEFADLPTDDPAEIAEVFENLGFEVEGMAAVAAPFSGVRVGRVTAIRPHPNADKIRLATVDLGDAEPEVVCGAWNFDVGDVIAFSPPGAVLNAPDGSSFTVDERAIRGVTSPGMICSLRELGLGDDHAGILVLPPDTPIGADFASLLPYPDTVFDLDVTPNRPDAMSTVGLARELAAHYGVPLREPEISLEETGPPTEFSVVIEDPAGCPRFTAREVRAVTVAPSPLWMRIRLEACGVRAISNVVDISNYVMLELGHPNHTFDKDRLGDRIVVRRARPGERITTLDEVDRELDPADIVITDGSQPVGIGGVMGGGDSEVSAATSTVLIEAAYFDPPSVLRTAKRHALHTEASSRFQRGMDPNNAERANRRVAQLLVEHAGGEPAPGAVDAYPVPIEPRVVRFPLAEYERVMGEPIDPATAADLLTRLGFAVEGGDVLDVTVPTRRPDVSRPVDFVEDLARLRGYNSYGDRVATGHGGGLPASERRYRRLREVMVGAGYHEAATFSFIGQADLDRLELPEADDRRDGIEVSNPLDQEQGVLRTTLLPGLLAAAAANVSRRVPDVALFETGKVFIADPEGDLPRQPETLAFVAAGRQGQSWHDGGREPDVLDATGTWHLLADVMQVDGAALRQAAPPAYHPERAAEVVLDGTVVGVVGEIHPRVADAFGLEGRVAAGEIRLTELLDTPARWEFRAPSVYPPVIFDLAFDVADEVPASRLLAVVGEAAGPMLESVVPFDVFTGSQIGAGRRSIAVKLTVRSPERTLTDEEVAPIRKRIAAAVEAELDGRLRGEA